ncbi:deoxynucleoside kinase [Bacillus horti]|uniref:Deoxyguanosine kinase n=1 Tax=Caldalkalibacillus horti TaxID=77523 RepID=A0ABT9W2S0_9BACI|nr:deoxynucleoside kinase [Bacillus horti]MDQ0167542.1 deoxyguanosine kinase [Bacillus horti]
MKIPFISIEGPIGVGKTSLSKEISKTFQFHLLQEIVEENPFLDKFYQNMDEWSFQMEMFFLCNRYKQLFDIQSSFLAQNKPVVADYHIFKNTIFARRTLQPSEWQKYIQIYDILVQDMPKPNLIIYLNASLETLIERIQMRGREMEKSIDQAYLQQLSTDYRDFMYEFKRSHPDIPVLEFNGDELDFVASKKDLNDIIQQVSTLLEKENQYECSRTI